MINCIILAGGNSIRMTFPKEYIEIEEKYLIHNSIEILKNVFDDIVVVSNNKGHYKYNTANNTLLHKSSQIIIHCINIFR